MADRRRPLVLPPEAIVTNKVVLDTHEDSAPPQHAPPLLLPGAVTRTGRVDHSAPAYPETPLGGTDPRAFSAPGPTARGSKKLDRPVLSRTGAGNTAKSLRASVARITNRVRALPRGDSPRTTPPERPNPVDGRPRVQLRVPTGWLRSVGGSDIKRRKVAVIKPPPEGATEPEPDHRRARTQFIAVMGVIALLNAPLVLVGVDYVKGLFFEETEASPIGIEQLVRIELELEARPGDGEAILESHGMDRHRWSELRGAVTADPELNERYSAIRARLQRP